MRRCRAGRDPVTVEEEQGIYRGEVRAIMIALADVIVGTREILDILLGEDDEEEA